MKVNPSLMGSSSPIHSRGEIRATVRALSTQMFFAMFDVFVIAARFVPLSNLGHFYLSTTISLISRTWFPLIIITMNFSAIRETMKEIFLLDRIRDVSCILT